MVLRHMKHLIYTENPLRLLFCCLLTLWRTFSQFFTEVKSEVSLQELHSTFSFRLTKGVIYWPVSPFKILTKKLLCILRPLCLSESLKFIKNALLMLLFICQKYATKEHLVIYFHWNTQTCTCDELTLDTFSPSLSMIG